MAEELERRASGLLERARKEDGPSSGDRTRVRRSLLAAVAAGTPPRFEARASENASSATTGSSGSSGSGTLATTSWLKWGALLFAGAFAGALWLLRPPPLATSPDARAPAPSAKPTPSATAEANAPAALERGEPALAHDAPAATLAAAQTREHAGSAAQEGSPAEPNATQESAAQTREHAGSGPARLARPAGPTTERASAREKIGASPNAHARASRDATEASDPSPIATLDPAPSSDSEIAPPAQNAIQATPTAPPNRTARELLLIKNATQALGRGELLHVLSLLDAHAREFPKGVLGLERDGLRVLALCRLGRLQEGRRLLSTFLVRGEGTPLAARVRAGCMEPKPE